MEVKSVEKAVMVQFDSEVDGHIFGVIPSITTTALSTVFWQHEGAVAARKFLPFFFPLVEGFDFALAFVLAFALAFACLSPGRSSLPRIIRWVPNSGPTPHLFGLGDHDCSCKLSAWSSCPQGWIRGEAGRSLKASVLPTPG